MGVTGERDHYGTEQVVFRSFIVPLRLGRKFPGIMIESTHACEIILTVHEVGCRTELSSSAWRDRRSTDILHKSSQRCSRGFERN